MKNKILLLFSLIYALSAECQVKEQMITAFGAVADGQTDFCPAFVFDDVTEIEMTGVTIPAAIEMPVILL